MRKIWIALVACGVLVMAGCDSGSEAPSTTLAEYQDKGSVSTLTTDTEEEAKEEETETEETPETNTQAYATLTYTGETAMYRYLDTYEFDGTDFGFTVYLPGKEAALQNGAATSSLHGITMAYEMGTVGNKSMFDVLSDAYKAEKNRIGSLPNTEDIEVPDAISGDSWALQEIDFKAVDGEVEYACYSYLKVDILDDIYVMTRVTLMGNQIDDDSQSVLTEAVTAAGITIEDVEFGEVDE